MDGLPERSNQPKKERAYRTSLPALEFLKLEKEALERGITPYKLTALIMAKYVNGQLQVKQK